MLEAWAKRPDEKDWPDTSAARVVSAPALPVSTAKMASSMLVSRAGVKVGAPEPAMKDSGSKVGLGKVERKLSTSELILKSCVGG